jgi:hypothetical protein
MKKIHLLLPFLFAISLPLARGAEMTAVIERPGADVGPTQVSVGIWIVDISNIDSAQPSFSAEVGVVLRWKDPRLTHTGGFPSFAGAGATDSSRVLATLL